MYLLFASAQLCTNYVLVNDSNLTPVFFKHASQDNPGVVKK